MAKSYIVFSKFRQGNPILILSLNFRFLSYELTASPYVCMIVYLSSEAIYGFIILPSLIILSTTPTIYSSGTSPQ